MKPIIDVARGSKMFWHEHALACIYEISTGGTGDK